MTLCTAVSALSSIRRRYRHLIIFNIIIYNSQALRSRCRCSCDMLHSKNCERSKRPIPTRQHRHTQRTPFQSVNSILLPHKLIPKLQRKMKQCMSVFLLARPKCTLAALHAALLVSHVELSDGTDRRTDGQTQYCYTTLSAKRGPRNKINNFTSTFTFCMPSPHESVGEYVIFSGSLFAAFVRPFVRPDRSCYHDIL